MVLVRRINFQMLGVKGLTSSIDKFSFIVAGFTQYLLEDCHIFDSEHGIVCQEMTHPLSHYFIASSHNT